MSKLSKILHIALFGVFALIGVLILIGNLTQIGDAIDLADFTGDSTLLINIIVTTVVGAGIAVVAALSILKLVKLQTEKIMKFAFIMMALVGLYFCVGPIFSIIQLSDLGMDPPGEIIALIIFGVLTMLSTVVVKKIKINGEKLKQIIALPIVGGLAAIASIVYLSLEPQELDLFVSILLLLGSLYFALLPVILKYGLKEDLGVEGSVSVPRATVAGQTNPQQVMRTGRPVAGIYVCTPAEDIRQAKALLDDGLIDEEEYKKIKAKIIERF